MVTFGGRSHNQGLGTYPISMGKVYAIFLTLVHATRRAHQLVWPSNDQEGTVVKIPEVTDLAAKKGRE